MSEPIILNENNYDDPMHHVESGNTQQFIFDLEKFEWPIVVEIENESSEAASLYEKFILGLGDMGITDMMMNGLDPLTEKTIYDFGDDLGAITIYVYASGEPTV